MTQKKKAAPTEADAKFGVEHPIIENRAFRIRRYGNNIEAKIAEAPIGFENDLEKFITERFKK